MLAAYARAQYQEMQVQTTPGRLVVLLYDGALRFLHLGLEGMRQRDLEAQGLNLGKAQRILCELLSTLDLSAGDLASRLASLYRYCLRRLLVANAENRTEHVEEVIRIMTPLREAWEQAERSFYAATAEGRMVDAIGAQPAPAGSGALARAGR
jgi:flagellar secretion chaperone FliS